MLMSFNLAIGDLLTGTHTQHQLSCILYCVRVCNREKENESGKEHTVNLSIYV